MRLASESKPQLAMQRKRLPLTSPTSIRARLGCGENSDGGVDLGGNADDAREIVAAAARDHAEGHRAARQRASDLADETVAAEHHRNLAAPGCGHGLRAAVLESRRHDQVVAQPMRLQGGFHRRQNLRSPAAAGGGVDQQQVTRRLCHGAQQPTQARSAGIHPIVNVPAPAQPCSISSMPWRRNPRSSTAGGV